MSDNQSRDHERLEAALRQLTPTRPTFQKEQLLLRAGQMVGRRARWRLALLTALVGIGSGIVGTYLGLRIIGPAEAPPQVVVIYVPAPAADPPAAPESHQKQEPAPPSAKMPDRLASSEPAAFFHLASSGAKILQMRDQALRFGVEALPMMVPTSSPSAANQPSNLLKLQAEWISKLYEY